MPALWTKIEATYEDPFDGSQVTQLEVNSIRIASMAVPPVEMKLPNEHYTYPVGTTDATIQADVDADLTAKGYNINPP